MSPKLPDLRWRDGAPRPEGVAPITACLGLAGRVRSTKLEAAKSIVSAIESPRPLRAGDVAGDLAFIAWAEEKNTVYAARDPAGAHGLYYRRVEGLRLASSATRLLAGTPSSSDLDRESLVAHLCWSAPPSGRSYFRDIRQIPPGSMLVAGRDSCDVRTYWQPDLLPVRQRSDEAWEEELRATLTDVVRPLAATDDPARRPLGLTLSGGLDSGSVAVSLAGIVDDPARITALRWTAPELPDSDEAAVSAEIVRRFGFSDLQIRADQHWTFCPPLGAATEPDGPVAVPFVGLWDASFRAARESGLRHLATGISGDHLLSGNVFAELDLLLTGRWRRAWSSIRALRRTRDFGRVDTARHLAQLVYWSALRYLGRNQGRAPAWLHPSVKSAVPREEHPRRGLPGRLRHRELLRDPVRAEVLRGLGAQAARHDLELHHPLLDRRVFELAASLPMHQISRDGFKKHLVRRAFRDRLPTATTDRPGKVLPSKIIERGVREREVARVRDLLTDMRTADLRLVDPDRARREYEEFLVDDRRDLSPLWPTITLEAWLRQHVS